MKKNDITVRSGAAEYLTYVAAVGEKEDSFEVRYEDENIWLTQKMMAALYDVSVAAVNQHIKKIFDDGELSEETTIKKYLIVQNKQRNMDTKNRYLLVSCDRKMPARVSIRTGSIFIKFRKILWNNNINFPISENT